MRIAAHRYEFHDGQGVGAPFGLRNIALEPGEGLAVVVSERLPGDLDGAFPLPVDSGDAFNQRRLTRSVWADDGDVLTFADGDRNIPKDFIPRPCDGEVFNLDDRCGHLGRIMQAGKLNLVLVEVDPK